MKRLIKGEIFVDYKVDDDEYICFKNPTSKEWKEITADDGFFRAMLLENGDTYIWNSNILHEKALIRFKMPDGLHVSGNKEDMILYLTSKTDIEYIYNCFKNSTTLFTYVNSNAYILINTGFYNAEFNPIYDDIHRVNDILNFK